MRMKTSQFVLCLLGIGVGSIQAAAATPWTTVAAVHASDLDLATAAGRAQLDGRLDRAIQTSCRGRSSQPSVQPPPGPVGRMPFSTMRGPSSKDMCLRAAIRRAARHHDQLLAQSTDAKIEVHR